MAMIPENNSNEVSTPPARTDFNALFGTAFRIIKNHPIIWLAGIIATLLHGNINFNFNFSTSQPTSTMQPNDSFDPSEMIAGTLIEDILLHPVRYLMFAAFGVLIYFLVWLIFGTWAQAALVWMGVEAEATGKTSLASGWRQSRQRLPALIGFQLLLMSPFVILMLITLATVLPAWYAFMYNIFLSDEMGGTETLFDPTQLSGLFCLIPIVACLAILLTIAAAVIDIYGFRSCLLAKTGPLASIRHGWKLFRQQLGYTIITGVIAFIVTMIVGFILLLPIAPLWFSIGEEFFSRGMSRDIIGQLVVLIGYIMIVGTAVTGLLHAFFATLWTQLYQAAMMKVQ